MPVNNFWAKITSRLFLLMATIALVVVGYGLVKSAIRRAEIEREIRSLQAEIAEHKTKSDELSKLIGYLNTQEYKEKEARLELGLQKPGENVVVITDLEKEGNKDLNNQVSLEPNWLQWLKYLIGNK